MADTQSASHIRLHDKEKPALEYANPVHAGMLE